MTISQKKEETLRKKIIEHKIKEAEENISIVRDHLPEDFEEFKILGLIKDGIYKKIEDSIEGVISICSIINSDLNLGIPKEEEDILGNFEKGKILDKKLIEKIKEMRGFRNILVHKYGEIDDEEVFENIKEGIGDFELFFEEIRKLLKKH